jgi:chromosome partitioning protein
LPHTDIDRRGEDEDMREDEVRDAHAQPDVPADGEDDAVTESQARIRRTLDAAVSRETTDESHLAPRRRLAHPEAGVLGDAGMNSYDAVPTRTGRDWHASPPAVGRATVPAAYQEPAHPAEPPDSSTDVQTDHVSRETKAVDEEPPLAMEARRAMQILNPGGEASLPRPVHRRVMCIANQKGGVGKTTTAVNLAVSLALHGNRVLVVDLDPQGNTSTGLGVEHHTGIPSIYEALLGEITLAEATRPVAGIPNLKCTPATIDLAGAEIELVSIVAREARLSRAIETLDGDLDYIFIDCPPSLGLLTVNALVAAEEVLIPIQCEYYALEGLGQLLRNIELVKAHLNPRLRVSTIVLTMYDRRTKLADQVEQEVRSHFGDVVLESVIPRSVRVSEAPGYGQSVMTYDPGSRGAMSYFSAAQEIALRGAKVGDH